MFKLLELWMHARLLSTRALSPFASAPVIRCTMILTRCGSAAPRAPLPSDSTWWLWSAGRPQQRSCQEAGPDPTKHTPHHHHHQTVPDSKSHVTSGGGGSKWRLSSEPAVGCDTRSHHSVYHKRKLLMMMFFFKCTNIESSEIYMCVCVCAWQKTSSCITLLRREDVIISLENWG